MLFCSNSILTLMGFAYRIALNRSAGASALGLNSLVMQVYSIVVSVCIHGMNVALTATAARLEKSDMKRLFVSALIIFSTLWLTAAAPVCILRKSLASGALGSEGAASTLPLMLFCIYLTGIENMLRAIHLGVRRVTQCAASELIEQGVRFALVLIMLKKLRHDSDETTVFIIMLGMVMSEFVSVSILGASFRRLFGKSGKVARPLMLRTIAETAFPATLTSVASTIFTSVGALLLPGALAKFGLFRSDALAQIGIINTVAIPVSMLPMPMAAAVAAVIMPEISSMNAAGRNPRRIIGSAFSTVGIFGAASSIILVFSAQGIAAALFGRSPEPAVFTLLIVRAFAVFMQTVGTASLNGMMMQKTVLLFAASSEAYQLILILLLVPVFGMIGYAAGMAAGELLRLVCTLFAINDNVKNGVELQAET